MKFLVYTSLLLSIITTSYATEVSTTSVKKPHKELQTLAYQEKKMTRGDVKIIEATENIRYLSQKIAQEYLFLSYYHNNDFLKKDLYKTLNDLSKNLKIISSTTKNQDTNNILDFLAYSKEQILLILERKITKEEISDILDYSDTLQEGAESIAKTHAYPFSKEEKMLVTSKNIAFLLERIMKYYMAIHGGYRADTNHKKLYYSILELRDALDIVNEYPYPDPLKKVRQNINHIWDREGEAVMQLEYYFIPNLLVDTMGYLEEEIDTLSLYHSKNL
jgi:hypothetical protein